MLSMVDSYLVLIVSYKKHCTLLKKIVFPSTNDVELVKKTISNIKQQYAIPQPKFSLKKLLDALY